MIDGLAWFAAGAALVAYWMLVTGRVSLRTFNCSEFLAAFPLAVSAVHHKAWPALSVTLSYGAIGLFGLTRGTPADE